MEDKDKGTTLAEEQVKLELIELLFRTPDDRMDELTNIPLNQVLPLTMVKTLAIATEMLAEKIAGGPSRKELLSRYFLLHYAQFRRSLPGISNHKLALATLAKEELVNKLEEEGESEDMP